jgi:2-phosphosulfolactate phosphatase
MKIAVLFTPHGLSAQELVGRGVIVLDVLRTTTTVITAVANGAKAVVPAATSEEAVRLTANLEKDGLLLAGERKSLKIEGFALGNSPREMTPAAVSGKTIYLATTNGTPALVAAQGGDPVLVGSVVNFKALVARARAVFAERGEGEGGDLVIVCAGREGEFALEDAYTAGRLVRALKRGTRKLRLNDAAAAAADLTTHYRDWADALSHSEAARQLAQVDLGDDVAFSSKPDRFSVVPTYADRRIT